MISIREQAFGLDVAIFNEFTLSDFKDFEAALLAYVTQHGCPDVLLDMSEVVDFTLDMALEELKFVRAHEADFGRVAIVVTDTWIRLAAHLAGLISHTTVKYFETSSAALAWLCANEDQAI